jgi:transcription-repair coupling factor (superfamily II helicase)
MHALTTAFVNEIGYGQIASRIESGGCPVVVSGLDGIHRTHAAASIRCATGRPVVVVCTDEIEMKRVASDLEAFTSEQAALLSGREFTFYNAEGVSRQLEQRRLRTLFQMRSNRAPLVVTTIDGLIMRTLPKARMNETMLELRMGRAYSLSTIVDTLVINGFSRCEQVEGPGQFAVRGGILDFFSPVSDEPFRCEFFGDEVDSISTFDISTQRRTEPVDSALVLPSAETLVTLYRGEGGTGEGGLRNALTDLLHTIEKRKAGNSELKRNIASDIERLENRRTFPAADKYMELIYPMSSALDYLEETAVIFINEPSRIAERLKISCGSSVKTADRSWR